MIKAMLGGIVLAGMLAATSAASENRQLIIEIITVKTNPKTDQGMPVSAIIRNPGNEKVAFQVWTCSFFKQWKSSTPLVSIKPTACRSNYLSLVTLKPGGEYTQSLLLSMRRPVTFRLGFEPIGYAQDIIWSNTVTIGSQR
jgi:hypothetical protein